MDTRFSRIHKNRLCIGCGLCESLGKDRGYRLSLKSSGFYFVDLPVTRVSELEERMANCCPAISLIGDGTSGIWGNYISMTRAYSTDTQLRYHASSGGIVSAICKYAIESGFSDAVLHVGVDPTDSLQNRLLISRTPEDVVSRAASRYAPALMFSDLRQILDSTEESFVFVGKSCDILAIKNFLSEFKEYAGRIRLCVSIFCAGMPSYVATKRIIDSFNKSISPVSVKYRGDGWPGCFTVKGEDGEAYRMEYSEEWNKYLGPTIHFRCKICPDSIGSLADISVGDAWHLISGKPDFKEKDGESCVLVRSEIGEQLIERMKALGLIVVSPLSECDLALMQFNHIRKRTSSAYKIIVMKIVLPGLIRTKNLNLIKLGSKYNVFKGLRDMVGAYKRFQRWIH